ncbi:hypothetical protein [Desulfobacula sp.]|jgi:hypothetical protein
MKIMKLSETNEFTPGAMKRFILVEKSELLSISHLYSLVLLYMSV